MSAYTTWIKALVDEFKIDGLRIDGKSADIACVRSSYSPSPTISPHSCQVRYQRALNLPCAIDNSIFVRHVNMDFWPQFCGAAGVYCIGEVFDADAG